MRISVLVDDVSSDVKYESEHGLSFHLDEGDVSYLFDVGASDMFQRNARRLGLNIADVSALFLSHGHRDHTGGLASFFRENASARVYATPYTFDSCYALRPSGVYEDIGTPKYDRDPRYSTRIETNEGVAAPASNVLLFSDVSTAELTSDANKTLFERDKLSYRYDRFLHEQNLIITSASGVAVLVVGCAHRGIVNIMNRCVEILGKAPDVVIGGFHLMIPSRQTTIDDDVLDKIAARLARWSTRYFTGHCVGEVAFKRVRRLLGEQISPFGAGDVFEF